MNRLFFCSSNRIIWSLSSSSKAQVFRNSVYSCSSYINFSNGSRVTAKSESGLSWQGQNDKLSDRKEPETGLSSEDLISRFSPVLLRDSCRCRYCADPSSKQKYFQTADIPESIKVDSFETLPGGALSIRWKNDIPDIPSDHQTILSKDFFKAQTDKGHFLQKVLFDITPRPWNKVDISTELKFISYDQYMKKDFALYQALWALRRHGLVIIRNVPKSETSVEDLAGRIGPIRDSFYGRTWDVKAVPDAKNVAYTSQNLGLHMDLLYMSNPPGLQFLHCLENTCKGGTSVFSDTTKAITSLSTDRRKALHNFPTFPIAFEYRNNGQYYYKERPFLEYDEGYATDAAPRCFVNYSPPFQANFPIHLSGSRLKPKNQLEMQGMVADKNEHGDDRQSFKYFMDTLRSFTKHVEHPDNVFDYLLKEGDCVIFSNRRVLHGRKAFETASGSRWLKGTYVDTDAFLSRYRVLREAAEQNSPKEVRLQDDHTAQQDEDIKSQYQTSVE